MFKVIVVIVILFIIGCDSKGDSTSSKDMFIENNTSNVASPENNTSNVVPSDNNTPDVNGTNSSKNHYCLGCPFFKTSALATSLVFINKG